jgi:tryptophan synthase beta chain
MGEVDVARQRPNVFLMEQFGATVIPVTFGNRTLKDAVNAAIKDWIENVETTHFLLGSALGPHPYPTMNRDFQSVISKEVRQQLREQEKKLPDYVIACVGGGSNSLGIFSGFIKEKNIQLIGVEAGGRGKGVGENAIRLQGSGSVGVVEGYKSYFLQDSDGQVQKTYSISAGLDYAGIGPELAYLHDTKRVLFTSATDVEVLAAVSLLAKTEGIITALESAHAIAHAIKLAPTLSKEKVIVVNVSGRGDKDLFILTKAFKDKKFYEFMQRQVEEGY